MKSLVLGCNGEVGSALCRLLQCRGEDRTGEKQRYINITPERFDVIHICYPYSSEFESSVKGYQEQYLEKKYNPGAYTVIHSTVPVGTSRKLNAVHSPVVGIHPHLFQSLTTFTKFLGGRDNGADLVADYFRKVGMKVQVCDEPETTELMKILCTTYYGLMIEFTKHVKGLFDSTLKCGGNECQPLPFEAWQLWVDNYNKGYEKLGFPEYRRPNLVPLMKPLGGHCVKENLDLLASPFTMFVKALAEGRAEKLFKDWDQVRKIAETFDEFPENAIAGISGVRYWHDKMKKAIAGHT